MRHIHNTRRLSDKLIFAGVCLLLILYIGIFAYLNMFRYTQHVDSDIAVDALLAREIWIERTLTPDNWIASTERLVVGVPALSAIFYGISGSVVFSMGLACVLVGLLLLAAVSFVLRRCQVSWLGTAAALLALCALPINGLRNEGQMVPFVTLLWFLFADYYALHSICLFLCIAFYLHIRETELCRDPRLILLNGSIWLFLALLCGGLALGGMRCLQVVALPLAVWECLLLFFESGHMSRPLPAKRFLATGFIGSLLAVSILARFYPTNVEYPMFFQTASGMADRLIREVPASVLECLGIAGNCTLTSFSALMQLGVLAVLLLTVYGIFYLFGKKAAAGEAPVTHNQKSLIQALGSSFLLTVFIEVVTTAETAHNYFFVIWFVIIATLSVMITHFEKAAPAFSKLIVLCICLFALCNIFYTYADCITTDDNLREYEEVISYMESQDISYGYAEFWDASRICVMTDGAITMGHSYQIEDLRMYWWTTSTKWYVPSLPEQMRTAYVVRLEDKAGFEAQFEDPSAVTLGMENSKFAVYLSDFNFVHM